MKKTLLLLLVLLIAVNVFGEKIATLTEIMKPDQFVFDKDHVYITEETRIFIYSVNDYKFIKKFGKQGQGPKEFLIDNFRPLFINVSTDKILVNSVGKISYFSKNGEYISEKRAQGFGMRLQPVGDQFIGSSGAAANNTRFDTLVLFDKNLKPIKELARMESGFQPGKGTLVIKPFFDKEVHNGKVILPGKEDGIIDVFDFQLKKLYSIKVEMEKVSVDQDFKNRAVKFLKTDPAYKNFFEQLKPLRYPDNFPTMSAFFAVDNIIYALTWKREMITDDFWKIDCLTYNLDDGKFIKRFKVPVRYQNDLAPFPIQVHKGKVYQLIENMDEEEWELHATELK